MADPSAPETREFYRTMRAANPVFFDEKTHTWCIFRYDDVKSVLMDWQGFSSDYGRLLPGSLLDRVFMKNMNALDPPRHGRLRGLVSRAFTPRAIADLEPFIVRTTNQLLDKVSEQGKCELNSDLASVLPTAVIGELLGLPQSDHIIFRQLTEGILANLQKAMNMEPLDVRMDEQFDGYCRQLLAERRARPQSDLLSHLLAAEVEGERLTDEELLTFCRQLIAAGISTSGHLISNAVMTLLQYPAELNRLRADERLLPSALEEVLRFQPPTTVWFRVAGRDLELRGQQIRAKQSVMVFLASANRDETVFPEPDRFDIGRTPNNHLSFSTGIHFCIGAPLARLEGRLAVRAILDRLPELALDSDGPLEMYPNMIFNGVARLPLRFRPSSSGSPGA